MLLQNQSILAQQPMRFIGGGVAGERAMFSRTERRNIFVGQTASQLAGNPPGYLHPGSWNMPNKPGLMTSSGNAAVSTGAAAGVQGLGGIASTAAAATGAANGVGIAAGVAAGAATSAGAAAGVGLANGTAAGTATATGAATTGATASGTAAGASTATGAATTGAVAWGIAGPVVTELTVDQIVAGILDAELSSGVSLEDTLVQTRIAAKLAAALSA